MKYGKRKIFLGFILMFSLLVSLTNGAFADQVSDDPNRESQIERLFDEKAKLLVEENIDISKLNDIDKQLENLGVVRLTPSEVQQRFPDAKLGLVKNNEYNINDITPQVVPPSQNNVSWSTYRVSGTYNGRSYEVQKLIAQANTRDSCLKYTGSRTITKSLNGAAGVINILKLIAGEVPVYGRWVSFFDAVSSTVSAVSRETTIEGNIKVTHTWTMVSTISYQYVKKYGESDSTQNLSFVSSKLAGESGWAIPSFSYSGGKVYPNLIQGKESYQITPSNYDNTNLAISAFVGTGAIDTSAVVGYVDLIGLDDSYVTTIYPTVPIFPEQIY